MSIRFEFREHFSALNNTKIRANDEQGSHVTNGGRDEWLREDRSYNCMNT